MTQLNKTIFKIKSSPTAALIVDHNRFKVLKIKWIKVNWIIITIIEIQTCNNIITIIHANKPIKEIVDQF